MTLRRGMRVSGELETKGWLLAGLGKAGQM